MVNSILRFADTDAPLAIYLLIDLSSHTFDLTPINGMTRLEFIEREVNSIVTESLYKCIKTTGYKPRHHISLVGYHTHYFDIPIQLPADHEWMNNRRNKANVQDHIYPIGVFDGVRISLSAYRNTSYKRNTAAAFRYVAQRIARNADCYDQSHPPIVIHLSTGLPDDIGDIESAFTQLTSQTTQYGATLVHTVFVGNHLCGNDQQGWQGITDRTPFTTADALIGYTLLAVTSRIPSAYQDIIRMFFRATTFPSDYFFIPGMVSTHTYWDAFIIGWITSEFSLMRTEP